MAMRDPGKLTLSELLAFLKNKETATLKLVGRDGAGKVTFLCVLAVDESARDLEPVINDFEASQG